MSAANIVYADSVELGIKQLLSDDKFVQKVAKVFAQAIIRELDKGACDFPGVNQEDSND